MSATLQKLALVINTGGQGLWSTTAKKVRITGATVSKFEEDGDVWGELRVSFNTSDWDVNKHGLIYTDKQAEHELKAHFASIALNVNDMHYSEQGMQGNDFISFDVEKDFIDSWEKVFGNLEIA